MDLALEQACEPTQLATTQQVDKVKVDRGPLLAASAALRAGWKERKADIAVAIAGGESTWNPTAANDETTARGMWQTMMSFHAPKYDKGEHWWDPYDNAEVAHEIQVLAGDWSDWTVYTSGDYLNYMDKARRAVDQVLAGAKPQTTGGGGADPDVQQAPYVPDPTQCEDTDSKIRAVVEWEPGDARRVPVDGETVELHTLKMLRLAERQVGGNIFVTQGSFTSGNEASEGTHDGGGVIDTGMVGSWSETVDALTAAGFVAWYRAPTSEWGAHIHAIDPASPNLSEDAGNQVIDWQNGGDGLGELDLSEPSQGGDGGTAPVGGIGGGEWGPPMEPGTYTLSNSFGECSSLWSSCHTGEDINGNPEGQPLYAIGAGKVTTNGYDPDGYGYYLVVDHGGGVESWYCHQPTPPTLQVGTQVDTGDRVGTEGATGHVTGVHLHLEVRINGEPTDPVAFMADQGAPL
jgi:hypothetical protein